MFTRGSQNTTQRMAQTRRDSLEKEKETSLTGFGASLVKNTAQSVAELGTGMFDQLLGNYSKNENSGKIPEQFKSVEEQNKQNGFIPEKKTLFSFTETQERQQIAEIKELIKQIKQEVDAIKRADAALMSEVKDIEKLTINDMPEKPGIYHIRFLELVLSILTQLKMKVNESKTWMEALHSKSAKKGSAFAARSKKSGTSYSMSEEIKMGRPGQ